MGLFDSLKDLGLDKIVDSIESAAEQVKTSVGMGEPIASSGVAPQNAENVAPQNMEYTNSQNNALSVDQKFEQIFATDFSDLQVTREVAPESLGITAPSQCRPYSYALWRNGQPVAAIMLTPHNRDRNAAFLNAKAAALNSRIAFLNFYTHFQNERNYVVSRIRNAL